MDRSGIEPATHPVGRGALGVTVLLPSILAAEAGGQGRFELDAETVGDALRALLTEALEKRGKQR